MYKFILSLLFLLFLAVPAQSHAAEKYAGSSAEINTASISAIQNDNRVKILEGFLNQYDSPLAQNAKTFVASADSNNIDWRLVAAISGVESTFGKFLPYESYNAWGWGIYGDNMIRFKSYDEAIETISKALREKYINQWGAEDVFAIGRFYAASPTWASRVTYFMDKMEEFERNSATLTLSVSL